MTIYITQILFLFFLWSLRNKTLVFFRRISIDKIALLSMFLLMFLTMALRDVSVGTDTFGYSLVYTGIAQASNFQTALSWSSISSAPVYVGIHYMLSRFINDYHVAIFVNSIIVSFSFYLFINNNSKNYCFSIFLFVALCMYFESMNGTRQFMAIGIVLNSYELLKKNILSLHGWMLAIIALGIHNTVVAFLGVFLVGILFKNAIRSVTKAFALSIIVSFIIVIGFVYIINLFVGLVPYFLIYTNGTNGAQLFNNDGNGRIALLYISLGIFSLLGIYFSQKKSIKLIEYDGVDLYICWVCVVLGIFFSQNILFTRILWPFLCTFIVYLPNSINRLKKENKQALHFIVVLVLSVYCSLFLIEDKSSIVPYIAFVEQL